MTSSEEETVHDEDSDGTKVYRQVLFDPARFRAAAQRAHGLALSAAEARASEIGRVDDRVGPYVLRERLGKGGMGEVYRAIRKDGQEFALKILSQQLIDDADAQLRFQREIRALGALSRTPGIARVHNVGVTPDNRPYFVMDYVPGSRSLAQAMRGGLPADDALLMLVRVSDVLCQAHRHDLIHRDIKPSNILVTDAGEVLLIDFGLAKILPESGGLTASGDILGTPRYMAPEQARGDLAKIGPRTDVYGLGAILYEILTGGFTPFHDSTSVQVIEQLGRGVLPPPPSSRTPGVDPRLEAVCMRALNPDPGKRYAHAGLFADTLDRALRKEPAPESEEDHEPPPQREPIQWGPPVAGAALVLVGWALGWLARGGTALPAPTPTAATSRRADTPTPRVSDSPVDLPGWFRGLPASQRPPSLPKEIRLGDRPHEYVNVKDGSIMVWVPAGIFRMGRSDGPPAERPVQTISLRGFFMGKYEVTWAQFEAYAARTGARIPSRLIEDYAVGFTADDEHPVFNLTWKEARAYCDWADLRLPSEAEWEYASRGTDGRAFPWGDDPPLGADSPLLNLADLTVERFAGDLGGFGLYERDYDDGHFFPARIGSFPEGASPFGCLDLAGNVWEYTDDSYRGYAPGSEPTDQVAIRGGSWDNPLKFCRTTSRGAIEPEARRVFIGFRVCRPAD